MTPGNRKTANFNRFIAPLVAWERTKGDEIGPLIKKAQSEQKTASARIDKLRKQAASAPDQAKCQELTAEIVQVESNLVGIPTPPRLIADDVTVEHVATLMGQNGERIGILSDEGGLIDTIAGRYSNGVANVDVYNKGRHTRRWVKWKEGLRSSKTTTCFWSCPRPMPARKAGQADASECIPRLLRGGDEFIALCAFCAFCAYVLDRFFKFILLLITKKNNPRSLLLKNTCAKCAIFSPTSSLLHSNAVAILVRRGNFFTHVAVRSSAGHDVPRNSSPRHMRLYCAKSSHRCRCHSLHRRAGKPVI
jgi:hypothetical protein